MATPFLFWFLGFGSSWVFEKSNHLIWEWRMEEIENIVVSNLHQWKTQGGKEVVSSSLETWRADPGGRWSGRSQLFSNQCPLGWNFLRMSFCINWESCVHLELSSLISLWMGFCFVCRCSPSLTNLQICWWETWGMEWRMGIPSTRKSKY